MSKRRTTLLTPEILADQYPVIAELRASEPVFWDDTIHGWLVFRHDDVKALLSDSRYSRDRKMSPHYEAPPKGSWSERLDNESFGGGSEKDHRLWRNRLSVGFTPRAVRRMENQVREVVEQFAAPIRASKGRADLVAEFTNPIPNTVISRITGIPPYPGDEDRFRCLAQDVIRRFFPMADEENKRRGEQALDELAEWVGKLGDERRQSRQEDLISDLIHGNDGDYEMTNEEIVIIIATLVAAGSETTTLGGTNVLRLLLQNPQELAKLRQDPSLSVGAVRESLRHSFGTAISGVPRFALEDIELRGKTIRKGDMVMPSTGGANRDPSVFEDPDRFDITRDTREMLAFGHGPHYCLGANLALQEMSCMIEAALPFMPEGTELLEDEIEWESIGIMTRAMNLPILRP